MNTEREPLPEVTTIEELQAAGYLAFKIKGGYVAVKAASEPIPGIAFRETATPREVDPAKLNMIADANAIAQESDIVA